MIMMMKRMENDVHHHRHDLLYKVIDMKTCEANETNEIV
jgi:hypothetical protein